jgi:two-component system sensor histidine kinase VanS
VRISLRVKFFIVMAAVPLFFTIILVLANSFLGYKFYLNDKKKQVLRIASLSRTLFESRVYNSENNSLWVKLDSLIENTSFIVAVYNDRGRIIYPSSNMHMRGLRRLSMGRGHHRRQPLPPEFVKEMKTVGNGTLYVTKTMPQFNMDVLGYQEIFGNNYELVIFCPLSQIEESAATSNRFAWIIGGTTMILCWIITSALSRYVSRPIVELGGTVRRLANLDFSAETAVRGNDELADLARDINWLSVQFKAAIDMLAEQNEQLQADVMLGKKNEQMRKNFISAVSHELKSPLFLIAGYTELLLNSLPAEAADKRQYAGVIMDEAEKMDSLLKTLLDLSQLEAGIFKIAKIPFAVHFLCSDLAKRYAPILEGRSITLATKTQEAVVLADIERVEQILTNYLNNALEHVDERRYIEFSVLTSGRSKVYVSVFNTGPYISEEHLQRIWEPFYKADSVRQRDIGGSGIGLSVVAAIQKASGNAYGVVNTEGGVLFWIELDVFDSAQAAADIKTSGI